MPVTGRINLSYYENFNLYKYTNMEICMYFSASAIPQNSRKVQNTKQMILIKENSWKLTQFILIKYPSQYSTTHTERFDKVYN